MSAVPLGLLPESATVADDRLQLGGCDVRDLAAEFGTPLFVYDEAHLRSRAREAVDTFGVDGAVYASKAFLCKAMARLAHDEGMRIDVATGGELFVALAAGVPPHRIVQHGNNKSLTELRLALESGVGTIVLDAFEEFDRIEFLIAGGLEPPEVLVRVTPGVEAHTHDYIATGRNDSKFGFTVSTGAATEAVERAAASTAMDLRGIHAHIGSQVFRAESYTEAFRVLAAFAEPYDLDELCIGGGLGVAYVEGERAPTISEWGGAILDAARAEGIDALVSAEPGRAIVASAAITLYTVGVVKNLPGIRTYVAVDGGMSDNPRPVLYGSGYETFLPRAVTADRPLSVRVVGKHCESGDILVHDGRVPDDIAAGDILATPVTGAYGHSMGSNYNKILRPAVIFVTDGDARLVVRRETYDDLLATDVG